MTQKKHRNIRIDGVKYGWTTHQMGKRIKIWKDKQIIFETENNSPDHSIKPSYIKEIIKQNDL